MLVRYTCILFLFASLGASAFQVARITPQQNIFFITHTANIDWRVGDTVCTVRGNLENVCGTIAKVVGRAAIVRVRDKIAQVKVGDLVKRTAVAAPVKAAAPSGKVTLVNLTVGTLLGTHYMIPSGSVGFAINDHFALGVLAGYRSVTDLDTSVTMIPILLSANYYHTGRFDGLWGQLAAGFHMFSATAPGIDESAKALTVLGSIGYRLRFSNGLNLGAAVGGESISLPTFQSATFGFSSFQGIALFDIGFSF